MKYVKQLDEFGCGIAAVAMIVNKSYTEVKNKFLELNLPIKKGTWNTDQVKVLKYYGIKSKIRKKPKKWKDIKNDALVIVYGHHTVVYNKKKHCLYDPALHLYKYKKYKLELNGLHTGEYIEIIPTNK